MDAETQIAEIERLMRSDRHAYDRSPELQAAYRDAIDARERSGRSEGTPVYSHVDAMQIAEIERLMRTDRHAYDHNPALQAAYRDAIDARERSATST